MFHVALQSLTWLPIFKVDCQCLTYLYNLTTFLKKTYIHATRDQIKKNGTNPSYLTVEFARAPPPLYPQWCMRKQLMPWAAVRLMWCSALQYVALCCSVLQCVAVCCSVLQCVAVFCSVLQWESIGSMYGLGCAHLLLPISAPACVRMLQSVAVCCSVVQCGTVCCSLLQCAIDTHTHKCTHTNTHSGSW